MSLDKGRDKLDALEQQPSFEHLAQDRTTRRGWLKLTCLVLLLPVITYYLGQSGKLGCFHRPAYRLEGEDEGWIRDALLAAHTSKDASPLPGPEFEKLYL